ncbi:hypothetical protein BDV96DRAFT_572137 [Lophiotrema nucula]|uniref:Uncharacterized protein n=1 Tax=Lophiotrema nucula TaxID=690887 RepID=A0A6A5ZD64_9PLEO|nr:hypothetical protein BDV96DRAFT_572137 [Lophiotrema nucula]
MLHAHASRRNVRILPSLSSTGLMQCEVSQDTIDAMYACLLYVWGSENYERSIPVNGMILDCLRILWDYLNKARVKYTDLSQDFWIDPIYINQNSNLGA